MVKTSPSHGENRGSSPLRVTRKNDLFRQVVFSVIFALRQVKSLDCFASYELTSSMFILVVKYIITETEGFIITFTK